MSYISKRRVKKAILSLTVYGESNKILRKLSENVSPAAKLEQAVFGVSPELQKRLRIQTEAANAAAESSAVRAHRARLFGKHKKVQLARLAELY